jgi:hypothetical protein
VARNLMKWQRSSLRIRRELVLLPQVKMAAVMFTNVRIQVALWDGRREATWILHLKKRLSSSKLVHWQIQSTWRSRQDSDITS